MKAHDLRQLGSQGVEQHLAELTRDYSMLLESVRAGKEKNYTKLGMVRKDIARVRTVLRELERGASV